MYGFVNPYVLEPVEVFRNQPNLLAFVEKDALVQSGRWSVPRSSDGTTYGESDLITDASKIVANAWWVVQSTSGQSWCLQAINLGGTTATWRVKHSRAAGFTGGAPSSTVTPSAADELVVRGGGTDAAPTGEIVFADAGAGLSAIAKIVFGVVDRDSDAFYLTYKDRGVGGGAAQSLHQFFCDPFADAHVDDAYPYWFSCAPGSTTVSLGYGDQSFSSGETQSTQWAYYSDGAGTWTARKTIAEKPWNAIPNTSSVNPITGAIELHAMLIGRPTSFTGATDEYTRGISSLFLWVGSQVANPQLKTYAESDYIHVGEDIVGGWTGVLPATIASIGTWTDLGAVTVYLLGATGVDTTAPTLTPTKASGTIRRHEALTFVAADNVQITNLTISIRYEGDDSPTVVYDGSSFWGAFRGVSTIVGDETAKTITLLPHGGWRRRIASLQFKINDGNFAV